ncbi:MAG TPA: ribosome biogenesis GTPase Der, partial [Spirochaetota bacterium]|nr:ribosome biogenesis GTPase Der [Spirochaetota bacterium]
MYRFALIGKTNSGKSSLYNLLCGTSQAITGSTENSTRDIKEAVCKTGRFNYLLYDLGGMNLKPAALQKLVHQKAFTTMQSSDALIAVFDSRLLNSDDKYIIKSIKKLKPPKPVIYLVNKVDKEKDDYLTADFYKLGIPALLPFSCLKKRNVKQLKKKINSVIEELEQNHTPVPEKPAGLFDYDINISIIGKPNTGKSSLCNRLTAVTKSIVAAESGTTRDPVKNFFSYKNKKISITDTAGMRQKNKSKNSIEQFSVKKAVKALMSSDLTLLVIDALQGLSGQDKKICSIAVNHSIPLLLLVNKWDLITAKNWPAYELDLRSRFPHIHDLEIIPVSACTGQNLIKIKKAVLKYAARNKKSVRTTTINKTLQKAVKKYPPRHNRSGVLKIYYAVQVKQQPPVFKIFVNDKTRLKPDYRKYLENQLK